MKLTPVFGRPRPPLRPGRVRDRTSLRRGVVQRDPAGDHLRRDEVIEVAPVLMHAERLRTRRLPDAVVLDDPYAVPPHQRRSEPACPLPEHLGRDAPVGLPAVADLTGAILGVASRDPVHLVWANPGLVAAGEQRLEPFTQERDGVVRDEALFHDDEAVAPELVALLVAPALHGSAPRPALLGVVDRERLD